MTENDSTVRQEYLELQKEHPALFANSNGPFTIISDPAAIRSWQEEKRSKLRSDGLPENWAGIGVLCDDPYVLVIRDLVQFPDGARRGYIRICNRADLSGGEGVAILARKGDEFLLLHQFRHATRSWHLEVPRGFGEPGIPAAEQAASELAEEVGGQAEELVDLGTVHPNTGLEGNSIRLFFARLSSVGHAAAAEGIAELRWVRQAELEGLIRDGTITDAFTISAYTRALLAGLIERA